MRVRFEGREIAAGLIVAAMICACSDRQAPPAPAPGEEAPLVEGAPSSPVPPPSVVLVTLESARADRLGPYRAGARVSPQLDQLAADGIVYGNAYTPSNTTLAAHASLLTGRLPARHGAGEAPDGAIALPDVVGTPEGWQHRRAHPLPAAVPTLAEALRAAGYATAAVVSGPWLVRAFGLGRGFDLYEDRGVETLAGRPGADVTDSALAWLDADPRRPVLLFVSYFEPHAPYQPPLELARQQLGASLEALPAEPDLAETSALYDAELAAADLQLGRLLDGLRERGLYDDAWILVTADHGVLLGEHVGLGHGETLWEEELRVPLVVKPPRGAGAPTRVTDPVLLTDLLPMLLEALGLPVPAGLDGAVPGGPPRPLIAEQRPTSVGADADAEADSDTDTDADAGAELSRARALIEWPWKLHRDARGGDGAAAGLRLYDLASDPREQNDLAPEEPARVARMAAVLAAYEAALPRPVTPASEPERTPPAPVSR
jgi:arylsulfatase A-like enzyme